MDILQAAATARVALKSGDSILVRKGSFWPADDPVVREYPALFGWRSSRTDREATIPVDIVYATATTHVGLEHGSSILVGKGTHWPADDPVVRAHPDLFSPDARYGLVFTVQPDGFDAPTEPIVETATANPGEKRNTRRGT
jgi:hypothetical protein